jgi:hypothetical protein
VNEVIKRLQGVLMTRASQGRNEKAAKDFYWSVAAAGRIHRNGGIVKEK